MYALRSHSPGNSAGVLLSQPLNHSGLSALVAMASKIYALYVYQSPYHNLCVMPGPTNVLHMVFSEHLWPLDHGPTRSVKHPPRRMLLSDIKSPLSTLKSIQGWAGRYPLSTTTYYPFSHLIYGGQSVL